MKSVIMVLLLLCRFSLAHAQKKNHEVVAIAFYNFENLFDAHDDPRNHGDNDYLPKGSNRYTEEVYQQKLHNLATVLVQLGTEVTPDGPAIIGTAEIENSKVLEDLVAQPEIRHRGYRYVHFDSKDSRGIDVALLYQPAYFRVLAARALPVDLRRHDGKERHTRDVLYVLGVLAGDTVNVLVNHWPSRRGGEAASAPLRALAAVVNKVVIDSITRNNASAKIIVMGDFNDDPTDASITRMLGASGDKTEIGASGIYNPFLSFYKKGIGTLAYNDSWSLFDQIMLTRSFLADGSAHWIFHKAEVFNKEFIKTRFGRYKGYPRRSFEGNKWANGYSDHFPVLVYLVRPIE